jgi:hypothetical protein
MPDSVGIWKGSMSADASTRRPDDTDDVARALDQHGNADAHVLS